MKPKNPFLNWFYALFIFGKPWHYKWGVIYRNLRTTAFNSKGKPVWEGRGRLRSIWWTITFPHEHQPEEYDD